MSSMLIVVRFVNDVLSARRWPVKEGEAEESMANYIQRSPGKDECRVCCTGVTGQE